MLNEKQEVLFQNLKRIKDKWVEMSVGSLHSQSDRQWTALQKKYNDMINLWIT